MTPQEIEQLVRRTLEEGVTLSSISYSIILLLVLGGAYLGSYFKTRGMHHAIKRNFKILLAQTKQSTETIEAVKKQQEMTSWVEQRRWDLKREMHWNILDSLFSLKEVCIAFTRALANESSLDTLLKFEDKLNAAVMEISRRLPLCHVVFSTEGAEGIERLRQYLITLHPTLSAASEADDNYRDILKTFFDELTTQINSVQDLLVVSAREDLLGEPL